MNTLDYKHYIGFVKAATQSGLSYPQTEMLYKQAGYDLPALLTKLRDFAQRRVSNTGRPIFARRQVFNNSPTFNTMVDGLKNKISKYPKTSTALAAGGLAFPFAQKGLQTTNLNQQGKELDLQNKILTSVYHPKDKPDPTITDNADSLANYLPEIGIGAGIGGGAILYANSEQQRKKERDYNQGQPI